MSDASGKENHNPQEETSDDKKKERKLNVPPWGKSLGFLLIGAVFFIILFYVSPLSQAVLFFLGFFKQYLLAVLSPSTVDWLINYFIWWCIAFAITLAALITLMSNPDFPYFFNILGKYLIVIDVLFFFLLILWWSALNFGVLDSVLCTAQYGIPFQQISPELGQRCATYQQSQLPAYAKKGTHTPLSVSFGITQPDGSVYIPAIYRNDYYSLPLTLKNADTTEDLSGIAGIGWDKNDTCTPGDDCIQLLTNVCSQSNPCTVPSGKSLPIVMKTDEVIHDKTYSYPDFLTLFEYQKNAYGASELKVVRSLNDIQSTPTTEPQSNTGPLDVVIYFAPGLYIEGSATGASAQPQGSSPFLAAPIKPANPSSTTDVTMYVAVANFGIGYGRLQNITIQRVGDYSLLDKLQCAVPLSQGQTFSEGQTENLNAMIVPKLGNVQFTCDIKINDDIAKSLLNNNHSPSQSIPFTASVNYNYYETYTYSAEHAVQNGGNPISTASSSQTSQTQTSGTQSQTSQTSQTSSQPSGAGV